MVSQHFCSFQEHIYHIIGLLRECSPKSDGELFDLEGKERSLHLLTTYSEWGPEHGELEFIKRHSVSACNVPKRLLGIRSAEMNYSCSLRKADQEVLFRKQGEDDSHRAMPRVSWGCREHGEDS